MVAYEGEKMSKSKGNLVRVSQLRKQGVDPMVIRLLLLDQHYRTPWEYTDDLLIVAKKRCPTWKSAITSGGSDGAAELVAVIRAALADDLNAPLALAAVDAWADTAPTDARESTKVRAALAALLGLAN